MRPKTRFCRGNAIASLLRHFSNGGREDRRYRRVLMASPKIRCGVAGVGSLGQHHARIYASLPGAELAGIYETSDARAAEICAKLNCRRFATLAELARRLRCGQRGRAHRSACGGGVALARESDPPADRETDLRESCGGRTGPDRGAAEWLPRAGRAHRAFQSGDEFSRKGNRRAALPHGGATRALSAARHGGRRGARLDDPRHRHRARLGEIADRQDRQRGGDGALEKRGHCERAHSIRKRLRRQPQREAA